MIEFLAKHMEHLQGMHMTATVGELLVGCKPVISVNIGSRAIDAFKLMAEKHVSAVAVVDDNNHMISNISARDIRMIASDERVIQGLFMPIRNFLQLIYSDRLKASNPAITCGVKDSLVAVFQKLAASKVHRVYVADSQNCLIGVIALSDALRALVV